jgi:GntR family transcriptional repressor for pyruvate dehydrogenase complex
MSSLPRVPRVSVTRQVVEALYESLRTGRYRPGERLPSEPRLAVMLGVGRSAVREAVRELQTLDVLEVRHGRGTFVRGLRPELMGRPEGFSAALERTIALELLEVRMMFEPEAAALAARRATTHDVDRLRHDVAALETAVALGVQPPEDLGFHLDLVRAAHNGSLLRISSAINAFYEHDPAMPTERDVREHRAVAEAVAAGDQQGARGAMRAHLQVELDVRRPER